MDLWFNKNYSVPLEDERNKSKSKKNTCLKYIVALQFIAIIILIVVYSKQDSLNPASHVQQPINTSYNTDTLPSIKISDTFPYRNQYCADPIGLISELVGRWYGDTGVDTVFGITTYYTEFLTFEPLTYGVINRAIPGAVSGAEQIFGVRYFRQIISNSKNKKHHPFARSTPIHEETGYLLFMFVDASSQSDNVDQAIHTTFKRVVKSIAIPRGQTVLAEAEYNYDNEVGVQNAILFDAENNVVKYILRAGDIQSNENCQISNGDFTEDIAMVPSFEQKVEIDLTNHIFAYNQSSPIILHGKTTQHMNMAILTKLNI